MVYVKQNWENLPSENTPISAARLAHMETQYDEAVSYIDSKGSGAGVFNVKDFGAVGDGTTDDSAAFKSALSAIQSEGGGVLVLEGSKTYWCSQRLELVDNLTIRGNGAWMIRRFGVSEQGYAVWRSKFSAGPGYGSGGKNIHVSGINFRGSFEEGRERMICGFSLHHVDDMVIEDCSFWEGINTAHYIDMQGCRRIRIKRISLHGVKVAAGNYARTEAIQVGASILGGESAPDPEGDFDGLPCSDISVEDVDSLPLTLPNGVFPAPNPVGSHDTVRTKGVDRNIYVSRVSVVDPVRDTTSNIPGVIKFTCVDNLVVSGLSVTLTTPGDLRVIGLYDQAGGELGRVTLRDISISGVSATGTKHVIYVGPGAVPGTMGSARVSISNVSSLADGGSSALNLIHFAGGDAVSIRNVFSSGPVRGINLLNVRRVNLEDVSLLNPRSDSVFIQGSDFVHVSGVSVKGAGNPFFVDASNQVTVVNSSVNTDFGARSFGFRGCKFVVCNGNIAERRSATTIGVNVYNSPAGALGSVTGNVLAGEGPSVVADPGVVVTGNTP